MDRLMMEIATEDVDGGKVEQVGEDVGVAKGNDESGVVGGESGRGGNSW